MSSVKIKGQSRVNIKDQYQRGQSSNIKEREREREKSHEREIVVLLLKEYGISVP